MARPQTLLLAGLALLLVASARAQDPMAEAEQL